MFNKSNILIFILLIYTLFSSCSQDEKPSKLLDKNQMIDLLFDMSIAEGARARARSEYNKDDTEVLTIGMYYDKVFEKYNLTSQEFDSINAYYTKQPELYQEIFKEVLDSLNKVDAQEKKTFIEQSKNHELRNDKLPTRKELNKNKPLKLK